MVLVMMAAETAAAAAAGVMAAVAAAAAVAVRLLAQEAGQHTNTRKINRQVKDEESVITFAGRRTPQQVQIYL